MLTFFCNSRMSPVLYLGVWCKYSGVICTNGLYTVPSNWRMRSLRRLVPTVHCCMRQCSFSVKMHQKCWLAAAALEKLRLQRFPDP